MSLLPPLNLQGALQKAKSTEHTFMLLLAILIGVIAGLGAIAIRMAITFISDLSFPGSGDLLTNINNLPWWWILAMPTLGGLIVGPIIYFFAPEAKGTGVPEVMQAVLVKGGRIRPRVAIAKAICSSITIGTGNSVGREGPIIQIGSSIGSTFAQFFQISGTRTKTLVGCGAAAGIAAAFNAPIAGALFAVEIILMDFAVAQFSPIVIASVTATVISHKFEGNFAAFLVPHYELNSSLEIFLYCILGIACGLISSLFIKSISLVDKAVESTFKLPEYLKPGLGGLHIGLMALVFPQIMGVGYGSINLALQGEFLWQLALVLVFLKILATSITLGFGGSGGIFAPSLFVGAMLGAGFGALAQELWPSLNISIGAYALVGMGGIVAGTTRAPITAIIMIFELTNQYDVILPLMLTCILSLIISQKLSQESIYSIKLIKKNISIKRGQEQNIMKDLYVSDLVPSPVVPLLNTASFNEIVQKATSQRSPYLPIVNKNNQLQGMVSLHDIKSYLLEPDLLSDLIIAQDIMLTNPKSVVGDESLFQALEKMEASDLLGLPKIDGIKTKKLVGMVWQKDILDAYHCEVRRRDITSNLADQLYQKQNLTHVDMHGVSLIEIPTPKSFIGKSLIELDVRAKYGVLVLTVKRTNEGKTEVIPFPGPAYVIGEKDSLLVVAGATEAITGLQSLV
ncbi:MAG: chloride channel protein [SAR324 cluster bacterium]|nr:chloride channel protein [SAR324 cluster bacterium]